MFSGIPFLKLFIALTIGIILSVFFSVSTSLYVLIGVFSSLILLHFHTRGEIKLIPVFGLLFLIFIGLIGVFRAEHYKNKARLNAFTRSAFVIGKISKTPKNYDRFIKTNLEIIAIKNNDGLQESEGKSLLMIEKDSLALSLKQGDFIRFEPQFKEIESNSNPETFNYKRYLFFHLISQQTYLKSNNWEKLEHLKPSISLDRLSQLRTFLLKKYSDYGIKNQELSVLSALTLGYKNNLDYQIQKSYAASGAIHVLAVSGLHVGIVFVIIGQLLKYLGRHKRAKILRFLFTLIFIWLFALLTGGAPSVLRASLMFSFIALGQALNRQNSIYNSIFVSAFLLLLYNPFLLFDLSFQLSYSAVISIVYFQPRIYNLISVNHLLTKWVWGLTSVSLAAQIGTFPITIFYFHQFPNYFLLSNFIVIPLATVIIWLSLLFFLSLAFKPAALVIAYLLQNIVKFQNVLIQKIELLPYSLSKGLYLNTIQLVLLIISILILMQLLNKGKYKYWLAFGILLFSFFIYSDYLLLKQQTQKKLIVYNIKGFSAINLIDGSDNILISSLREQSKQKSFNLTQNWLSMGLEKEKHIRTKQLKKKFNFSNLLKANNPNFFVKNQFIQFFDKRILYLQEKSILSRYQPKRIPLDYIIIGGNTRLDLAELDLYFTANQIIIDSSHSQRNLQFWKTQQAINPSKQIYLVSEKGAYVEDFSFTERIY